MTLALLLLAGLLLVLAVSATVAVATGHWLAHRPPAPPAHPRHRHGHDTRTALDETGEEVDNTVFPRPDRFSS